VAVSSTPKSSRADRGGGMCARSCATNHQLCVYVCVYVGRKVRAGGVGARCGHGGGHHSPGLLRADAALVKVGGAVTLPRQRPPAVGQAEALCACRGSRWVCALVGKGGQAK
jgi:hypothetical protein